MHNKELRELLCSMLIGDGSLTVQKGKYTYFSAAHSIKQEDYLLWKLNLVNEIFVEKKLRPPVIANYYNATCRGKKFPCIRVIFGWSKLESLNNKVYPYHLDYKKNISYLLDNMSSDLHLAIWLMDDGNEDRSYTKSRSDKAVKYPRSPRYRLAVYGFSNGQVNASIEWFRSKYSITPRISLQAGGPILRFTVRDSEKIFQKIKPYIKDLKSMHIKFRWSFDKETGSNLFKAQNTPDKGEDTVQTTTLQAD